METYVRQSKPSARTLSVRAGHGQADMATVLQTYRNKPLQLAALTDEEDQLLQGKFTTQLQEDEDELLQGKFVTPLQEDRREGPLQPEAENRTGLPDRLKNGVEGLSGYSMDAVRVHYNSPRPAQLQALAYTQGTDIHVGPGQERCLGHEAWHVVQQMQGRVQPTTQLRGIAVNDNEGLEREADVMGEKVSKNLGQFIQAKRMQADEMGGLVQFKWDKNGVNEYLKSDNLGLDSITHLNDLDYTVLKIDQGRTERRYEDGSKSDHLLEFGWADADKKEIAINDQTNDDKEAAKTLVHEVAHADQNHQNETVRPEPFPDVLSQEIDAHRKEEEFSEKAGMALNPKFRDAATGAISLAKIEAYVRKVYLAEDESGESKPFEDIEAECKVLETIHPWPVPLASA